VKVIPLIKHQQLPLEKLQVYARFESLDQKDLQMGSVVRMERILRGLKNTTKGEVWVQGEVEVPELQRHFCGEDVSVLLVWLVFCGVSLGGEGRGLTIGLIFSLGRCGVCFEWEKLFPLAIRLERRNKQRATNIRAPVSSVCLSASLCVFNRSSSRVAGVASGGDGDVSAFHVGFLSQSDGRCG
jgi:hypothetical protein